MIPTPQISLNYIMTLFLLSGIQKSGVYLISLLLHQLSFSRICFSFCVYVLVRRLFTI